ncbi:endo-1,4-beta-xylanase [Xylanimonas cellulosilytica]|uniref:endo-1,4-beta-xylanase n=1 Tax=Xylanimonas cellulosilytica TaxID=186189 RepID=UPI00019C0A32|nr:endo-1,4-beta-xylanase [Xylanimonas cellulosilytica]
MAAAAVAVGGVVAGGVIAASPATSAAPTTVTAVDFEDGTTGDWTPSGAATLAVVDSPDGADDGKVLSITRAADYEGIQSPTGIFEPGVTYDFSMRARLGADVTESAGIRFVAKPAYSWIGNTTITNAEWTTVSGSWTAPADGDPAEFQAYLGTADLTDGGAYEVLVDDILVTTEGPAEPGVTTVASHDFSTGSLTDAQGVTWAQAGITPEFVGDPDDADNTVLSFAQTADWQGLETPPGVIQNDVEYTISARVRWAEGTTGDVRFVSSDGGSAGWSWIGNTAVTDSEWTTIGGTFKVVGFTNPIVRLNAAVEGTLLVDDVVITTPSTTPDGPTPGTVVIDTDFEDQTTQGWTPRQPDDTTPTLAVVEGGANDTAHAAQVSDRDSDGDGLQFDVAAAGVGGATLEFEAWVRFAEGQPTGELTLSARTVKDGSASFSNLSAITGVRNDGWVKVGGQFAMPTYETEAEIYFEAKYNSGNVSPFLVDEVRVWVPEPPVVDTSLPPLKDTIDIPGTGVAIDSRETTGNASELLLHHFNQITPENHMKVEAWYDAEQNFRIHPEAVTLLDFAAANDLRLYGHVLLWHSQTPAWFFQREDGTDLTTSEADKQFLRDRLRTHIDDVAKAITDNSGLFGSDTNPMVGIDVVNEVVSDANEAGDGLRRSPWYNLLGEEFISLAFEYADEAFNHTYAAEGSDRPVTLFINDYNTEQSGKQDRYFALVQRLLAAGVPVDGVGHQFHASISTPISSLDAALARFADLPVVQAVTELDVTIGTPVTQANLIKQGHWYAEAFDVFRAHAEDLFGVTVWGLTDNRSWRAAQAPVLFDAGLQAKEAYFGAAGLEVSPLLTAANVFGGDVALDESAGDDAAWRNLPAEPLTGSAGSFVPRWTPEHLTLLVSVASDASDAVEVELDGTVVSIAKDGTVSGGAEGLVIDDEGDGWRAVLQVPLSGVAEGDSAQLDVRVSAAGTAVGAWNSPGSTGTLTFLEELSTVDVVEAAEAPVVDGVIDAAWADANVVTTAKTVEGAADGATAEVRTLWAGEDTLYVLAEVTDAVVDVSSPDPWNQDSLELFLDLGNTKSGNYGPNDAQMRISAQNATSFGTGDAATQAARLTSATTLTDTGYVVELAVVLRGQSGGQDDVPFGGADTFQGLDFQVNDGRNGSRYAVHTWAEPTGTGYQSTARWGVGHLVEAAAPEVPEYDAWDASRVYLAGDRVVVDGRVFEAQWWTQNQSPVTSGPWGSWMELGAVVGTFDGEPVRAWTNSWVFDNGDVVAHDGDVWRARWWTRNQPPGDVYGPWERIGSL